MTNSSLLDTAKTALSALSLVSTDAARYDQLSDDDAFALSATIAEERRLLDAQDALVAGVFAKRSAPELGGLGLAQKLGKRNPENCCARSPASPSRKRSPQSGSDEWRTRPRTTDR